MPGRARPFVSFALVVLASCAGSAAVQTAGQSSQVVAASGLPCPVEDVLARKCRGCHQDPPVFGAPMPLMTWADTQAPAVSNPSKKVYELMSARTHDAHRPMPPTGPLAAPDLGALDTWIAAGAPSAADTCGASDGGSPDGSTGALPCNPDQRIAPAGSWAVSSDLTDEYVCYGVDITTTAKRHAIAIAPRVQNKRVVHHMDLFQAPDSYGTTPQACSPFAAASWRMVFAWAPGGQNMILPPAAGFPLEGTTHYVVQVHYSNVAHLTGQTDETGIDICTTDQLRPNDADVIAFGTDHFTVPPRSNYDLTCNVSLPAGTPDIHVFASMPHMHNIGHALVNTLHPAGSAAAVDLGTQTNWNPQNQTWFAIDATVRSGDVVSTRCAWANTTADSISYGDTAADEMCYAFTMYYPRITSTAWSWAAPAQQSACSPTP